MGCAALPGERLAIGTAIDHRQLTRVDGGDQLGGQQSQRPGANHRYSFTGLHAQFQAGGRDTGGGFQQRRGTQVRVVRQHVQQARGQGEIVGPSPGFGEPGLGIAAHAQVGVAAAAGGAHQAGPEALSHNLSTNQIGGDQITDLDDRTRPLVPGRHGISHIRRGPCSGHEFEVRPADPRPRHPYQRLPGARRAWRHLDHPNLSRLVHDYSTCGRHRDSSEHRWIAAGSSVSGWSVQKLRRTGLPLHSPAVFVRKPTFEPTECSKRPGCSLPGGVESPRLAALGMVVVQERAEGCGRADWAASRWAVRRTGLRLHSAASSVRKPIFEDAKCSVRPGSPTGTVRVLIS